MPPSRATDIASAVETQALQVLTFGLGREVFALETAAVHEVLDIVPITAVPNSRRLVRGLINVRGRVVPVVDLKGKFGMPASERTAEARIVVIEVVLKGEPTMVGLLADRVHEVTELAAASLEEAPRIGTTWRPEFIRAIGKREDAFIVVMDIDRVFASEEPAAPQRGPAAA